MIAYLNQARPLSKKWLAVPEKVKVLLKS